MNSKIVRGFWLPALVVLCSLAAFGRTDQQPVTPSEPEHLSHVRVVRLSFVDGTVMVKRPGSNQWAKASVNTPLQQGFDVSTSKASYAEVEFENGSTARLGELSELDFTVLALRQNGDKVNRMSFMEGYGTFHITPEHGDEYSVAVGNLLLEPHGKAVFRTDLVGGKARTEVFSGNVEAVGNHQHVKLTKDKVLMVDTDEPQEALNATKGIEKDDWDKWVGKRDQQASLAYNDQAVGLDGNMYGWSDLDEYGDWAFFPGYGYGWSPYASMGWAPFTDGMFSYYPGMGGYSWIGAEPWGWLPYHYGMWNFDSGFGYFWMPGGFGAFSPALVNWYGGPGWIGWTPYGIGGVGGVYGGGAGCATGQAGGCLTAVSPHTLQNGGVIGPNNVLRNINPAQARPLTRPNIPPHQMAMLSGTPIAAGTVLPRVAARAFGGNAVARTATGVRAAGPRVGAAVSSRTALAQTGPRTAMARGNSATSMRMARSSAPAVMHGRSVMAFNHSAGAPNHILMGMTAAKEAAAMHATGGGNTAFDRFGRALFGSNPQPLTAHMGQTLGGRFPVNSPNAMMGGVGTAGNQRMGAPSMGRMAGPSFGRGGPMVLPHTGGGGFAHAGGFSRGGGFGGGGMRGGGFSGAAMSGAHAGGSMGGMHGGGMGGGAAAGGHH